MNQTDLLVSEWFYSIQGESSYAGLPCCFIRLSGCNLRCGYCDSAYSWQEEGERRSREAILEWTRRYPRALVELTGGEPLLQENTYPLMDLLLADKRTVLLETNGSISLDRVPQQVSVIMDIKCPGSGMELHNYRKNIAILHQRKIQSSRDEIKFVLCDATDFFWAAEQVRTLELEGLVPVIFSPVKSSFPPAELARLILDHCLMVRLQLQLHTILWPEAERGV